MKNACVIGWGTVGKATALAFGIDKHFSRSDANITLQEAAKCRYIFICLPTPSVDGRYFTDDIVKIVTQLKEYGMGDNSLLIIRSTVYSGFANHLRESLGIEKIVSNPEFLSEDTWEQDAKRPDLVILGSSNNAALKDVEAIYQGRYKYLKPILTDNTTAELIKVSLNNFFSLKVIYANELFDYAQKTGANYETVKKALESHPWGSKNHFAPWYKDRRGLHGKCLPKDLEALAGYTNSVLLKAAVTINERIKNERA